MSLALVVGGALVIALTRSVEAFIYGGLGILAVLWIWAGMLLARRRGPAQLVLTDESISSPVFKLGWDRIAGIDIGETSEGGHRALFIEPLQDTDIEWAGGFLRLNATVSRLFGMPQLQILDQNLDGSVFELAREMEARAGRELMRPQT
jgi:hypothetical protein